MKRVCICTAIALSGCATATNNIVPTPVRLGNKNFYDREAIEIKILATRQD